MVVPLAPTEGQLRGARGAGLAVTAAVLAVAAHAAAGGALPDPATTALVTSLLSVAGTALAGRRRGPGGILGALGLSQCALHFLLQLTAEHHEHHAGMPFDSRTMLLGHAVAVLLTGLLLAGAEDALFLVARVLGWAVPRKPLVLPVAVRLRPMLRRRTPIRPLAELTNQRIHALRGPPTVS